MKVNIHNLRGITVHALWRGFAHPPATSSRLSIEQTEDKTFIATDQMSDAASEVNVALIQDFVDSLSIPCEKPSASMFGRSDDEVDWHFGGCHSSDYPSVKIELHFDQQTIVLLTDSNHVQLLPWTIQSPEETVSFCPSISTSLAKLMPEGFLFRERLLSSDAIWQSEAEMRNLFSKSDEETEPTEEPSFEENMARLDRLFDDEFEKIREGEAVQFVGCDRDYTANQLRRLTLGELRQLKADGYDLSISDETGQTALMMAAFPPFHQEQFEKLVLAQQFPVRGVLERDGRCECEIQGVAQGGTG